MVCVCGGAMGRKGKNEGEMAALREGDGELERRGIGRLGG